MAKNPKKSKKIVILTIFQILIVLSLVFYFGYKQLIKRTDISIPNPSKILSPTPKKTDKKLNWEDIKKTVMENHTASGIKQGMIAIPEMNILLPAYNNTFSDEESIGGLKAGGGFLGLDSNNKPADKGWVPGDDSGRKHIYFAAHAFDKTFGTMTDSGANAGLTDMQTDQTTVAPFLDPSTYESNGKITNTKPIGKKVYLADEYGIYVYKIIYQQAVNDQLKGINPLIETKDQELTLQSSMFPKEAYSANNPKNLNFRIDTRAKLIKSYSWDKAPQSILFYFDLNIQKTNARASWFNPGEEEGTN
ncbi:MAG: hypothetical protein LBC17_01450 [Lactobacillaceae bacterium]|jgi:sortase A|nr:hypothetical protein [Lactobacillaceae bacterium]